ncbi:hypothetical protein WDH52_22480 [Streptomyces sp. TRM70308]|uniref:hypothetical protein n=1 Tax=Streptomyces sp. TRM70308 TaxID=3131932 RepID=UPI003CFC25BB
MKGEAARPGGGAGAVRPAWDTLTGVLGAGTLLVPAALVGAPGAWGLSLAVAAGLALWCLLVAAAGGTRPGGAAALAGARLGPGAARLVHALYFGGIAAGQAALVTAAGQFAADGRAARWVAVGVLGGAAVCVAAGWTPPPLARRLRLAAVVLLAGVLWLRPGALALDGAGALGAPATAVVLLFAWVGLEGSVPAPREGRARLGGALAGLAAAAALYAVLLLAPPAPADAGGSGPLGGVAALVLGVYCVTNLQAAGAHGARLRGTPRGAALAAVAVALAGTALAALADWTVPALLLAPGAATATLYAVLATAALRRRRTAAPR